jgi:hypothetical protein
LLLYEIGVCVRLYAGNIRVNSGECAVRGRFEKELDLLIDREKGKVPRGREQGPHTYHE